MARNSTLSASADAGTRRKKPSKVSKIDQTSKGKPQANRDQSTSQNDKSDTDSEYTPPEVAKLMKVSNRTVNKWIDGGALKAYTIPLSSHRRVIHSDLVTFIREYDMPNPFEA